MKTLKKIVIAAAMLSTGVAAQAHAGVITYDLSNKEGTVAGLYVKSGDGFERVNFDREGFAAQLRYDDVANTVAISGTGFNIATQENTSFDLLYDDVTLAGNTLTLGDMDAVGRVDGDQVSGKGFDLTLLGDSLTASGWLTNDAGTHFGDFHFAGTKAPNADGGQVPAPAPLALIAAMGLFGAWRRRRSTEG